MIYAIWEHDEHGSIDSYCFKGFFTNIKEARNTYQKWKNDFMFNNDGWILCYGVYQPDIRLDANAKRNFKVIKSTEDE